VESIQPVMEDLSLGKEMLAEALKALLEVREEREAATSTRLATRSDTKEGIIATWPRHSGKSRM
jgi:hypothetical protein